MRIKTFWRPLRTVSSGFKAACVLVLVSSVAQSQTPQHPVQTISGSARVIDGDTIVIGQTRIRLEGIDAPESDQVCLDGAARRWTCGMSARDRLVEHVGSRDVTCTEHGHDRYGRSLGACLLGKEDLNAWMVREGWALSYIQYSHAYDADEAAAKAGRRGLWAGAFVAPWDWRHRSTATEVRGAISVPVSARAELLQPASAANAPSPECTIKGNVNRKGERIYHLAGSKAYSLVRMDKGTGERWFCTEEEAEAAGWRKDTR